MNTIVRYLREHFETEWNPAFFATMAGFIALCMAANYGLDFEARYIRSIEPLGLKATAFFCFYAFPYFFALGAHGLFYRRFDFSSRKGFWVRSLLGLALYALYMTLPIAGYLSQHLAPAGMRLFARRCSYNLVRPMVAAIPLFALWWLADRRCRFRQDGNDVTVACDEQADGDASFFYGFSARHFDYRPYALLLAIVAPLVVMASFGADFQRVYPRYVPTTEPDAYGVPGWLLQLVFELCYGVDYLFTEVFFRGFLVVGMARYLGKAAIVPMVAWYAFIHFGNPLAETMSAVVGGFVLGVIAYRTFSIYGGALIHLGVAYLMEIAAFAQRQL